MSPHLYKVLRILGGPGATPGALRPARALNAFAVVLVFLRHMRLLYLFGSLGPPAWCRPAPEARPGLRPGLRPSLRLDSRADSISLVSPCPTELPTTT